MAFSGRSLYIGGVVVAGLIGALYFFSGSLALKSGASTEPTVVRWLLAHEPVELYARATDEFARVLAQESEGRLMLEVVTPEDLGLPAGDISYEEVRRYFSEDQADISSVYVLSLAKEHQPLAALGLPYLFNDYESAAEALDGVAGESVFEGMESTGVYGLAYTLSGGFRVIASRATGIGVADLSGMGVTTSGGPIAEGILTAVGALPTSENAGAAETTYTRFAALEGAGNMRTIIETGHSLFLTAVVADASFYGTLSAEDKAALYLAARAAALVEREDSILLAEEVRTELESKGVTIITPSAEEKQALIEQTAPVYAQFEALFAPGLVQSLSGK